MIRYILTKILNKYKLYLCLFVGIISMVMVFSMIFMFRNGSEYKAIQRSFTKQREITGYYPAYVGKNTFLSYKEIKDSAKDEILTDNIDKIIDSYHTLWNTSLGLPEIKTQKGVYIRNLNAKFSYHGEGHVHIGYLSDINGGSMQDHYTFVSGADLNQDISKFTDMGNKIPENAIPCLVSRTTADSLDLVVGELIFFNKMIYGETASEEPLLSLYVSGIIEEKRDDYYWINSLKDLGNLLIIDKKAFESILKDYPKDVTYDLYEAFDYRYVTPKNTETVKSALQKLQKDDEDIIQNFTPVIKEYKEDIRTIRQMLFVIVLPLIVLVLIFIGMISFRIIDSEAGELTTLRNRGLSKARLIIMYVVQSFILAGVSIPFGLLSGYLFGRLVAGVTDFMDFTFGSDRISVKNYNFNLEMLIAGLVGALIAVIVMLIPVFLFFKKRRNKRKQVLAPVWEKYFIDVIIMIVSIYLLFNYNKQIASLSSNVLNGKGIDPVIFINTTLFLFACGMIMLRLIFYMVSLFYKIGVNRFSPTVYSGVIQILRTRKSSAVISIFLVITVAMSLFNANMARTINANKEARIKYETGSDIRVKEHWSIALQGSPAKADRWKYTEPSLVPYTNLVKDGLASSIARVLIYDRAQVKYSGSGEVANTIIQGINPKEFGETASLRDGMTDIHWYNYLNALADEPNGVVISRNMVTKFGIREGDDITISVMPPKITGRSDLYASVSLKVVGVVDVWPGYNGYSYDRSEDSGEIIETEGYLAIMNYTCLVNSFGVYPYEVWIKTDRSKKEVSDAIKKNYESDVRYIQSLDSWRNSLNDEKSTAIMQITNGFFTADFLISLILCIIGYLIYWITSIRDRELLFGIYRAMGISRKEINQMLVIEQVFLSLTSILAGILAGALASKLFIRVFSAVYLPEKHNMEVFISSYGLDLVKMGAVLLLVVAGCVLWIRRIIKGLNITEALKLGDD